MEEFFLTGTHASPRASVLLRTLTNAVIVQLEKILIYITPEEPALHAGTRAIQSAY
jgi:hypothetical protein